MLPNYSKSACVLLLLSCWMISGCQRLPEQEGLLDRVSTGAHVSANQLRVMVNEFAVLYADRVELRADQILANTSEPEIRKNALRWKINGISASFQAASRPDPLGAYLDVWILNRQTIHFFGSPAGNKLFGDQQRIALEECYALDRRLQHIQQVVGGELRLGEEFVETFAAEFPLTSLYFDREPIASRYIEEVQEPVREMFHVIANLDENVNELKKLAILYAGHLPKQARWEAELLLIDTTQLAVVQRPLQDFSQTADAASRMANVAQLVPQLAERERHAFQDIVANERLETLRDVDRMRRDTLVHLADERTILLTAMQKEREAVMDSIREERIAATSDLSAEIATAVKATDSITQRRTDELVEKSPQVIDHFFARTWQLCVTFALAGIVIAWLIIRTKTRTPRSSANQMVAKQAEEETFFKRIVDERTKAA